MSTSPAFERRTRAALRLCFVIGSLNATHCAPSSPAHTPPATLPPGDPVAAAAVHAEVADDARGGRLYDNWRSEKGLGHVFTYDDAKTPALDGKGGPNGNGTLNDGSGRALPNTGHDYRLKNLFGWDLRGAEGLSGPTHQKKAYVLARNLLSDTRSPEEITRWLALGDEHTPAYGQVLDPTDLADLTAFLVKTRDGALARPEQVYRLEADVPKNYVLNAGADLASGRDRYAKSCSLCHGDDGRMMAIDETESVGTLSRTSGYEIWFKIQNGHPASTMERQVSEATGAENAKVILDLLAALCDRTTFPPLAGQESKDVADGDRRCGEYLK